MATKLAEVCRSCLSTESKTRPITGELEGLFSMMAGVKIHQWEPSSVCYLCLAVLLRFKKFKDQCCKVNEILMEIEAEGKLNLTRIKSLDRVKLCLDSVRKAQNVPNNIDIYPITFDPIKEERDDKYVNIETDVFNAIPTVNFNTTNCNDKVGQVSNSNESNDCKEMMLDIKNQSNNLLCSINTEIKNEISVDDYYSNSIDDTDSDTDLKTIKMKSLTEKRVKIKLKKQPKSRKVTKTKQKLAQTKNTDAKSNEAKTRIKDTNDPKTRIKDTNDPKTRNKGTSDHKKRIKDTKEASGDKKKISYQDILRAHEIFKENFKIYKFDIEEQIKEFGKRKESPAYLDRPFKCDICFKGFHMASVHEKHMILHEEQTENYCSICRIYFKTTRNYKVHKHQHEHKYTCVHCDFVSDRRSSASTHVKSHSGNIDRCNECGKEFKHRTSYANHLRVAHPSRFACADCGFAFVSEGGREQHVAVAHKDRKQIPPDGPECMECKIKFSNENALVVHIGISHPDKSTTEGKIKYINDNYKNNVRLTKYSFRKKSKPTDIVCEKCGEHLRTQLQYHWHFTKRHPNEIRTQVPPKSILCDLCGKAFKSELHLKYHIEDHNKTVISSCEHCPKTFTNRFAYYRHKYSHKHAGVKKGLGQRHGCTQCGVTFSSYSNRDRHVKFVHSNERHHFCDYCNKGFKSDQEKKTHIEHVHFKKPWPKRSRGRAKALDGGSSEWPTS